MDSGRDDAIVKGGREQSEFGHEEARKGYIRGDVTLPRAHRRDARVDGEP